MLLLLVALYLAITVAIGLWASRRVSNSTDFLVAGRSLPLYMNLATVFSTWFGAETVLAVSSTFLKDGLHGVVGDPFGAAFCLVFVGLFFARPFYRMDLITIGDFFRKRYNRSVEVGMALAITLSYLGWSSAQLVAMSIVINTVSGGAVSLSTGVLIGAVIVIVYTLFGGMWSVAMTDLVQTVVIITGLIYVAWLMAQMAGGFDHVIAVAHAEGKLQFWPKANPRDWLAFVAAWLTMSIGSIAQQDVFQRVTSARDEKTAVRGTLIGGALYLCMAFVPMFIAICALLIDAEHVKPVLQSGDTSFQLVLPQLVLSRTPLFAQVMFFGALLSAILSTASGSMLAPTAVFTENFLRPLFGRQLQHRNMLTVLRVVMVIFGVVITTFALQSESSMYRMVEASYKVTLVTAFTPLAMGLFWKRANVTGASLSIVAGLTCWVFAELLTTNPLVPPQLLGLIAAMAGMIVGSLASPQSSVVAPARTQPPDPQAVRED